MDKQRPFNVLFLCTGNSARSIIAESILRQVGAGRFLAYSAGSHPTGIVNPFAIEFLRQNRLPTDHLRSKDWNEFAQSDAPPLDFVFTVCDNAAGEVCPIWPGQPMTAHWGVPDPAAVRGSDEDKRKAFSQSGHILLSRIRLFVSLPIAKLDRLSLAQKLAAIGTSVPPSDAVA
ncbi:MAG TPA: arsenate reductase ArsC [Casimicrobiaceae bacterium]|nr:arsenate reductase ArsC [Casimicrobiaceae bacterium]